MGCFLFKQKTGYELRISDWSSDVCSSDLINVALGEKIRLLKGVGPIIVLFTMVTGVLFVGIATPVEAASLGAFGAMMFVLIQGKMSWRVLRDALFGTAKITAMITMIIAGAHIFGYFLKIGRAHV